MDSNTFLDDQISAVGEIKRCAETNFSHLSDHQFDWQPKPGKWSISQNFEHLSITSQAYLNEIREAIKLGMNQKKISRDFQYSLKGKWFIKMMEPGSRFKLKTFKKIEPGIDFKGKESLDRFLTVQDEILNFLNEAYSVDLKSMKIQSPIFPMLNFRLGEAFEVILAHERRHLNQALNVTKTLEFPLAKAVNS